MNPAYILIATINAFNPKGMVSVPVTTQFQTRPECIAYLDQQVQAMRREFRGPLAITIIKHCEVQS